MLQSILRRIAMGLAAGAALAACAGVLVVALAFTLYALVEPYWGRAGAAASVAGAAAVLMALGAMGFAIAARPKAPKPVTLSGKDGVGERALKFVRDKPVTTVAAAIAAGFLAVRNPRYLGAAARAFLEGRPPKRR